MSLTYERLSEETAQKISKSQINNFSPYACLYEKAKRRDEKSDVATVIRNPFVRDTDKILHCPYFGRYADKTQVFSFYRNDDITRRSLHVQLVAQIAKTLGRALNLNVDLIEAIALGHDIGHPPFAHAGELYLDNLYHRHTGRHFCHNLQSIRVLDKIFPYNISLQTLDGIACHNGELELLEYRPSNLSTFEELDKTVEDCTQDKSKIGKLIPSTLEGCVVRISDIISYLGKDRQDAYRTKILDEKVYQDTVIGKMNAEIINNLTVNIVENSFGKPYIKMDNEHFEALKLSKRENYDRIYDDYAIKKQMETCVKPMMSALYEKLLDDLINDRRESKIFTHHINYINKTHYERNFEYEKTEPNQIVVDYIASMTDDYFTDLYHLLFPNSDIQVEYRGYFD
ncbi:MAG: HD domain-containing protein [Clostridia bacterium]|nr:HD domain-containing protein [Clostridia bacterium]